MSAASEMLKLRERCRWLKTASGAGVKSSIPGSTNKSSTNPRISFISTFFYCFNIYVVAFVYQKIFL